MILKSPEQVIYRRMISDPLIATLLGSRVFPILAPASAAIPFAVYSRTAIQREATFATVSGVPKVSLEIAVYAATYNGCRVLADAVRQTLDGYTGTAYSVLVSRCSLNQEDDSIATLEGGETPPAYQVTQTYEVLWQEI